MLPTVEFCGLQVTRLIIGANPFGGFSHQSEERDREMRSFHTPERIIETWQRTSQAGINTMITNNESENVLIALREYLAGGGGLQWIAQLSFRTLGNMLTAIDKAVELGCKAMYFHGGLVDDLFARRDAATLEAWTNHARRYDLPVGVAGHAPDAHLWVDTLDLVDFHAVCFVNCGSLHSGKGHRFQLGDVFAATRAIRSIAKPCIGYKIMAAGRIDARMAFEYAFANIKPGDVVNVGMHRGDKDDVVEENAALVREVLRSEGGGGKTD